MGVPSSATWTECNYVNPKPKPVLDFRKTENPALEILVAAKHVKCLEWHFL